MVFEAAIEFLVPSESRVKRLAPGREPIENSRFKAPRVVSTGLIDPFLYLK
jgi:hypothetical protein